MRPAAGTMPLRVMLVDDHEVVRNGIKSLLKDAGDITIAAEAGSVKEAVERALWARPDVVVMDIRLTLSRSEAVTSCAPSRPSAAVGASSIRP